MSGPRNSNGEINITIAITKEFPMSKTDPERSPASQSYVKTMRLDVDVMTDRFWVCDNAGDDAQVRLEPNGKIYLCYTKGNRQTIKSVDVSWEMFMAAFRRFVDSIKA
jgi:hypothetical protein